MDRYISKIKKSIIEKFVSYYDGGVHFYFVAEDGKYSLIPCDKPKLIQILSRKSYKESCESIPFMDGSSLKKVLKLKSKSEDSIRKIIRVGKVSPDSVKINIWSLSFGEDFSMFTIPETALCLDESVTYFVEGENYFCTNHNGTVYSSPSTHIINSIERFSQSKGIPCGMIETITHNDFINKLVGNVGFDDLKLFSNKSWPRRMRKEAGYMVKGFLVGLVMYALVFSSYLYFSYYKLNNNVESYSESLSEIYKLGERLDSLESRLDSINSLKSQMHISSSVILVLDKVKAIATLNSINFENNIFVIRGNSEVATNVLEALLEDEMVINAKFDFPTRSYRDREEFVISFSLKPVLQSSFHQNEDNEYD